MHRAQHRRNSEGCGRQRGGRSRARWGRGRRRRWRCARWPHLGSWTCRALKRYPRRPSTRRGEGGRRGRRQREEKGDKRSVEEASRNAEKVSSLPSGALFDHVCRRSLPPDVIIKCHMQPPITIPRPCHRLQRPPCSAQFDRRAPPRLISARAPSADARPPAQIVSNASPRRCARHAPRVQLPSPPLSAASWVRVRASLPADRSQHPHTPCSAKQTQQFPHVSMAPGPAVRSA